MSRSYNGTTDYLERTSAILTSLPFTVSLWFNPTTASGSSYLFSITRATTATDAYYIWSFDDEVKVVAYGASSTGEATATTTFSANTWVHACGVWSSTTDRRAFINGGNKGTNTTSITVSGSINRTCLGSYVDSFGRYPYLGGLIAEVAIWNVALTDEEVAVLGAAVSPMFVRPGSLLSYWPLYGRGSVEMDVVNRSIWTVSGPVAAEHCRIIQPAAPFILKSTSPVAAGGGRIVGHSLVGPGICGRGLVA